MTSPIALCCSPAGFFIKPDSYRPRGLNLSRTLNSAVSAHKIALQFVGSQSLLHLSMRRGMHKYFVVYNSVPDVPPTSGGPPGSWKGWVLGIVISVVIPFLTSKWGPFLKLKNIEAAIDTAEHIVDEVEKVAETVEKVAEDVLANLPAGNLKDVVSIIENVAERTGDGAESVGDFIDKVQDVEEKVESFVESFTDEENEDKKEASSTGEPEEPTKGPKMEQDKTSDHTESN